jgi:predicted TIM-barrel fold metal-dependent hydrolase
VKGRERSYMKIDIFCHIMPDRYKKELFRIAPSGFDLEKMIGSIPTLTDLSERFRMMDQYPGLMQIPTISAPAVEAVASPEAAAELARIGNDELAELVEKYPDRFPGAVATLPMNNIDAALMEIERAITDLKLKGILIFTPIEGESMDQDKFFPVYEKMADFDLPIWIHPRRERNYPDYPNERQSKFSIHSLLGWPLETSMAMVRMVMSGIFERLPNLKVITHHCGAMIPYFSDRLAISYSFKGPLSIDKIKERGNISK